MGFMLEIVTITVSARTNILRVTQGSDSSAKAGNQQPRVKIASDDTDNEDAPTVVTKSTCDKVINGQVSPGNPHLPAPHVWSKPTSSQRLGRANPPASGMYQLLITRD